MRLAIWLLLNSSIAMALLALVVAWLALSTAKRKASVPARPEGHTLRFSDRLATRCTILASVGAAWGVLFALVTFSVSGFAFPTVMLVLRFWIRRYKLHLDRTELHHELIWGGARSMQWVRLASVRLAGPWLVLTDEAGSRIHVSRYLDGLGALALHIDDCASPSLSVDERTREFLLHWYRAGLVEAKEDPDKWLAERSGPLTQHARKGSHPQAAAHAPGTASAALAHLPTAKVPISVAERPPSAPADTVHPARPSSGPTGAVRYDIVIRGLAPGADRASTIATLARTFGVAEDRIASLLQGDRAVVKRGADESTVARYLRILRGAGVRADAEPHGGTNDSSAAASGTGAASAAPSRAVPTFAEMPTPPPAQAPQLEAFLQWATRTGTPRAASPLFREAAQLLLQAAGDARLSPAIADAVVWQEESRGAPEVRLQVLRAAGEALLRFDNEVDPAAKSAAPAGGAGHRPTIEAVRKLIGTCIVRSDRSSTANPPRIAQCRRVMEVATLCPASELGIRRGDLVVSMDLEPAAHRANDVVGTAHDWEFYLEGSREIVRATTNGVQMGIRLGPTGEAIKAGIRSDCVDLLSLWEMGEFQIVHDRCRAAVAGKRDCPEYVLLGAALMELGRADEGFGIIADFLDNYAQRWTSNYTGLGLYYLALSKLQSDQARATELALAAYENYGCPATVDLVEKLTGKRLPLRPAVYCDRPFAVRYDLPTEDGSARVGLQPTLGQMPDGQLLAVCALGGYRANGPYSVFMSNYAHYVSALPSVFFCLHVITANTEPIRETWLAGEQTARRRGTSFLVLHDANDTVMSSIGAAGSPTVLAIDKQGVVRGEHLADEIGIWQALTGFARGPGE